MEGKTMISTLHIKNIGIIDDVMIDFQNGLNVLTGETGAGKTLIIDALEIIAGGRFSKEMIRRGEEYSFVEICLYMPYHELAIDGNIIVSREINTNGKNLCKINGRLVTVNELKDFMNQVVDIHGQYDNQTLLDKNYHTKYLDLFGETEIIPLKKQYLDLYQEYQNISQQLVSNFGDEKEKQRQLDLLQYQFDEISAASLEIGEEANLEERRTKMINAEKIVENLSNVDYNLNDNAIDLISDSIRSLEKIENIDHQFSEKLVELKNVYYEIQEIARDISELKEDTYFDERERSEVETRIDTIYSLKRKYGNSIEEILEYAEEIQGEIDRIKNLEEVNQKLKEKQKTVESKMHELCEKITILRKKAAQRLNQSINQELFDLDMKNASFQARIMVDTEFSENGLSHVEFMISTNLGEEEKSLIKVASGGEISRIMLAIKTVLADIDEVPILVFDEIDTGISGGAANMVGEKLQRIAQKHQILIVTHLATIAAKGDYNYYIYKETEAQKTKTRVKKLTEEETIKEIARIASGKITEVSLSHAQELRKRNAA